MSYKLTCPNPDCDRYTSAIFQAYEDGRPCPYCDTSLTAASAQYYRQLPENEIRYPLTPQFKTYEVKTRTVVARTYRIQALTEEEAEDHHLMGELVDEQFDHDEITDTTQIEDE